MGKSYFGISHATRDGMFYTTPVWENEQNIVYYNVAPSRSFQVSEKSQDLATAKSLLLRSLADPGFGGLELQLKLDIIAYTSGVMQYSTSGTSVITGSWSYNRFDVPGHNWFGTARVYQISSSYFIDYQDTSTFSNPSMNVSGSSSYSGSSYDYLQSGNVIPVSVTGSTFTLSTGWANFTGTFTALQISSSDVVTGLYWSMWRP